MIVLLALGCAMNEASFTRGEASPPPPPPPPPLTEEEGGELKKERAKIVVIKGDKRTHGAPAEPAASKPMKPMAIGKKNQPAAAEPAGVREWFPESFIWRPSLQTGADGVASLDLRVPDQLTTWRLLALAHDDQGQQTGTVHHFDSALPVSVEPLVPGWLYAGDQLRVYGRASALGTSVSGKVRLSAGGALTGGGVGSVQLGPGASRLVGASLRATSSGVGTVFAEVLAPTRLDAAERQVQVRPVGRRIDAKRGGLVPQSLTLKNPQATEQRVSVRVFPGPLAFFQSELDRIADAPPAGTSYAVLQGVAALSASAGIEVDIKRLRGVRLRAWQRLVKRARSPSPALASRLLHGIGHPTDSLAKNLRDRLVRATVEGQRGDGSWSAEQRSTVQRVLVETAVAARALPDQQKGPRLRAAGAIERLLPNVDDAFTAAWVLHSGVVDDGFRADLQDTVLKAVIERDGVHTLRLPADVLDAQGHAPSRVEALAVVVLALQDRSDLPWKGELVSELLQQWSAARGFGAGWADAVALEAVRAAMPALDQPVSVFLLQDGIEVGRGGLDPKQPAVPVALDAVGGGTFRVACEPALPGLAYVLTHSAWVPFTGKESLPGVDVEVEMPLLFAGQTSVLTVRIAAPSGAVVEVEQGVPAGTSMLAPKGRLASHRIAGDHIAFTTQPFGAGEVIEVQIPVTPQYRGVLHTPPLVVRSDGIEVQLAPALWRVQSGEGA